MNYKYRRYNYLDAYDNIDKTKAIEVTFFRHQGLYMCHAYFSDFDPNPIAFYLTERNEHITKGQARKRLQELFPNAKILREVVPRNSARDRW